MTTAHGCVSDKHHRQLEQYLPLSLPGEQSGRQDLPLKNRPHTRRGAVGNGHQGPLTRLLHAAVTGLLLHTSGLQALSETLVQEQSFELELHGSRK